MTPPSGPRLRIDVILGRCDDMRAEVYVRAAGPSSGPAPLQITGTLVGPETRLAVTLPTVVRVADLGPGPDGTAVGRAILTEPGYWTPELPHRYRLVADVKAGGAVLASCDRLVGVCRLGVRGRSLWLEGRRWVPRGVACAADEFAPPVFRDLVAAAVLDEPTEEVCAAADEAGVAIIARCGSDPVADCGRWAGHASVMLAVMPPAVDATERAAAVDRIRSFKGTMLLGLEVDGQVPPSGVPDGVDFLVVSLAAGAVPHADWREPPPLPVLVRRAATGSVAERRAACDALQAELAAWRATVAATWDWAGYL